MIPPHVLPVIAHPLLQYPSDGRLGPFLFPLRVEAKAVAGSEWKDYNRTEGAIIIGGLPA